MDTRLKPLGLALLAVALSSFTACSSGPVAADRGASCAFCRMSIANPRLAAQLVAPGEEPRLYDDIGCLLAGLDRGDMKAMGSDAVAYVADHRSGAWAKAADAIYTRVESLDTPMGSHLIAHADAASRAADRDAAAGTLLRTSDVFGPQNKVARDAR